MGATLAGLRPSLREVIARTERHLEQQRLLGWDPYDALCSPLFRLPVLRSNRAVRFGAQQLVKRAPWNVRTLLGIRKALNPVAVGLYLQGQAHLATADATSHAGRRQKAERAVEQLADTVSGGYSGSCWGYPFDWETRYGTIPAGTPTIVATGMIANALFVAHEVFDIKLARELVLSSVNFVTRDLNRVPGPAGTFCWSYSPVDRQSVLNATLKGSRLLAQARALGGSDDLLTDAARSAGFVALHQAQSGAWPYSIGDARRWADNFHTGYVLEGLSTYCKLSGDPSLESVLAKGWRYYRSRFFIDDLTPKYYDHAAGPVDATACAQAIITLVEFGDVASAVQAAHRSIDVLARGDGSFAYQERKGRLVRTPFLRWSSAWMYCGLSRLISELETSSQQQPDGEPVLPIHTAQKAGR